MNSYDVIMMDKYSKRKLIKNEIIKVEANYINDKEGIIYFHNKEDKSDMDQPIAMFNKNEVKTIIKNIKDKE